jgi:hypothetical protein
VDKDQALQEIEKVAQDPFFSEGSFPVRDSVRILLASLLVGPNADKIARFLGLNRDTVVRPRVRHLRENGVFQDCKIVCDWYNKENGHMALLLDALVAEGLIARTSV